MYWLDLLRLLALLPLTISAGMDSRIKASIIPAWFILISLKVDFYQLYYTAKVQKSQLRIQTKIRLFRWDERSGPPPSRRGRCPHRPEALRAGRVGRPVQTNRSGFGPSGRMRASAPTRQERRSCLLPRLNVLGVPSTPVTASPCHPLQAGEGEKTPAAFLQPGGTVTLVFSDSLSSWPGRRR